MLLLEGDDYIGRSVNLASRLCDLAGPGQLLAAADGLELPEWVVAAEPRAGGREGHPEPVPVVALSADRAYLRRMSRSRSATALLAVVEGLTRPMRNWGAPASVPVVLVWNPSQPSPAAAWRIQSRSCGFVDLEPSSRMWR